MNHMGLKERKCGDTYSLTSEQTIKPEFALVLRSSTIGQLLSDSCLSQIQQGYFVYWQKFVIVCFHSGNSGAVK